MAKSYRVLTLDGGGMRGIYTAAYLHGLISIFARERQVDYLDLGRGFDLIVGTSTGAIIACALAKGVRLDRVVHLYRVNGPKIFEQPLGEGIGVLRSLIGRSRRLRRGAHALQSALAGILADTTVGQIYQQRRIALAIPAVEMSRHRSYVFKTPHLGGLRDANIKLVDACMASSAAPIFRSLAAFTPPDGLQTPRVFADGGLWANNPILVGLLDALRATEPEAVIELFAMGTCQRPEGEQITEDQLHRGIFGWRFGGLAAQLSIAAQESAFDHMARLFANELSRHGRTVKVCRFPSDKVAAAIMPFLDLDNASTVAMNALESQARTDVDATKSRCDDPRDEAGEAIRRLFTTLPPLTGEAAHA